ncbi:MAG: DoxX family membrane protein [Proteobacteria bacterium]|nr:DoxX family membrane protein [Pseudomonadota bacterium]MBU1232542.1 DoxX family membrane protein [Pseudomonadota bacterium]MBU1418020.1 DoxX family membrane protein [Pseudomonadota bacterium]MBU1455929.1 DoxX family membrane protein [Pseudomonadota bacterium]
MTQNRQQKRNAAIPVALTWMARISRWLISVPFLYAGITKLADPQSFAVVIAGFGLLPEPLLMPAALLLPLLEIIVAAGLLCNVRICLPAAATLMILFIAVLSYGIRLGLDVDCGCFGPEDPEQAYHNLWSALFRDLGFLIPILYLFWFQYITDRKKTVLSF